MTKYNFGIEDMAYDKNGLTDYYWPIDREEVLNVRDKLLNSIIPIIRQTDPLSQSDSAKGSIRVVFKWFIINILELYQVNRIIKAFEQKNYELNIPSRFSLLNSIYNNISPSTPFSKLWAGPGRKINSLTGLKRLVRSYQINGFKPCLLDTYSGMCDLVALERNELLARQAKSIRACVGYTFPEDWFREIDLPLNKFMADSTTYLPENNIKQIGELVDLIRAIFIECSAVFNEVTREYLYTWMQQANYFVTCHINRLLSKRQNIPHALWTGSTGGTIWTRLLCHTVHTNGGRVIGHDHGNGDAHYDQLPKHFVEFDDCDVFVTYNQISEMVIRREMKKEYLLGKSFPEIQSTKIMPKKQSKHVTMDELKGKEKKLKIMYVSTAFHGYQGRLRTLLADPVYFDWQIRLLSKLQEWGHSVIYKPHPEGRSKAPVGFAEQFGHVTNLESFEEVMHQADVFIIDFIASTTVADMFISRKPIIYIDFHSPEIYPEAYKILKEACCVIDAQIDSSNRVQIDFNRMKIVVDDILNNNYSKEALKLSSKYFEGVHSVA